MIKTIIAICTHNRIEQLKKCLNNINLMTIPQDMEIEIVIVDDTKDTSAKSIISSSNLKHKIHYHATQTKGIAQARNMVLNDCLNLNPDYIAFIDDDEYPDTNWIKSYFEYMEKSGADILTGPTISKFVDSELNETKVPNYIKQSRIFNLHQQRKTGDICTTCATNNVFINAKILKNTTVFFDENFKQMSGEDLDFFTRLVQDGNKLLWCNEARVFEHIPPERCNIKYILKRNFNNGYLKIFIKKKTNCLKIKNHLNTFLNIIVFLFTLPFSILLGKTSFVKNMSVCAFNLGALNSIYSNKTFNFYE